MKFKLSHVGLAVILGALSSLSCQAQEAPTAPKKAKNVLFLFADDLGYHDLGCFGSSFYETPHLDALSKQSLKLTNAYAACPVCSPTRSSVMTGQYPARTKNTEYFGAYNPKPGKPAPKNWKKPLIPAPYIDRLPTDLTTLPEALKKHGYSTFFAGKWHLGGKGSLPTDHGFDINKGGWQRGGPYGGKKYFSPYGNPHLEDGPDGEHLPDRLATETVKFMKETEKPFFAMLSFYSVHTPLIGRQDLIKKYQEKAKKLGDFHKEQVFKPEFPRRARVIQNHVIYGAMVEAMDEAIGKVIQGLKDSGKYDNTIIIFFSDNGGLSTSEGSPTSNSPLRAGKGWLYEGGIKEPAMIRVPNLTTAGASSSMLVTSTDFYPTILDACGLEKQPTDHIDGVSILDQIIKPKTERVLFWHYPHWGNQGGIPGTVVRKGDWKLIYFYYKKGYELYNLKDDPSEQHNVLEKHGEKFKELKEAMAKQFKDTGAIAPTENENFNGGDNFKW